MLDEVLLAAVKEEDSVGVIVPQIAGLAESVFRPVNRSML